MKILLDNASFAFRGNVLLKNLTLNLEDESYYINGPMASGKSTLLKALALKLPLVAGDRRIIRSGSEISNSNFLAHIQYIETIDSLAMVSNANGFYQQRYHTGMEGQNLRLSQYLTWFGLRKSDAYHNKLLQRLELTSVLDRHLSHLSSGQLTKTLIVKSLLKPPEMLFLDNPFAGLDEMACKELQDTIWSLHHDFGIQLLITGRSQNIPAFISKEISMKQNTIYRIGNRRTELSPVPEINESTVSQFVGCLGRNNIKKGNILKLKNVSVQYFDKNILKNISFALTYGESMALIGKNGSGKSTLFSLICGDHPLAYANEIYLFGNRRGSGESIWWLKKNVGFASPELRMGTNETQRVEEILFSGFFDNYRPYKKTTKSDINFVDLLLTYFSLQSLRQKSFGCLSSGEQQLVIFIRSLVQHPPLLLLDEPYHNLDWTSIIKCNFLLTELVRKNNISLMFISHCQEDIPNIVNKYYKIENGRLTNFELLEIKNRLLT